MPRTAPTPGPWSWEEGQPQIVAEWNGKSHCIASVADSRLGWHEDRICEGREKGANARLIAAAPQLLEALKAAVSQLERMGSDGLSSGAYAAIAKAEGRS